MELDYYEAVDFIHGLTKFGINLGLGRVQAILAELGHPERDFPSVHIGGTNGKGSTVAFLESVALAAGLKTARYTSPHLSSYTERFVINRRAISEDALAELVTEIKPVLERIAKDPAIGQPTEFEVGTILAFLYFARQKVDLAIIEVGLGGRLDATNVLKPLAVGITHIDLDHQEYLGPDLESIAKEKAGIIKDGVPVVTASGYPETERVLKDEAARHGAPLYQVGQAIKVNTLKSDPSGNTIEIGFLDEAVQQYQLSLPGIHQAQNAAVAFGLVKVLKDLGFWQVSDGLIRAGFASTVWPGRLEKVLDNPVVLIDGGHNPDAFRALRDSISANYSDRPMIGLIGIQNNRPVEAMARIIGPSLNQVIVTKVPDVSIPAPTERLAHAFTAAGIPNQIIESPDDALMAGIATAKEKDAILLVVGSFYLIGHLRPLLLKLND